MRQWTEAESAATMERCVEVGDVPREGDPLGGVKEGMGQRGYATGSDYGTGERRGNDQK